MAAKKPTIQSRRFLSTAWTRSPALSTIRPPNSDLVRVSTDSHQKLEQGIGLSVREHLTYACCLHTAGATGSIPVPPTKNQTLMRSYPAKYGISTA